MRSIWLWIMAIVISSGIMVYQRLTGPTTPVRGSVEYFGSEVKFKLLRTWEGSTGAKVEITTNHPDAAGVMIWKRVKSHDDWQTTVLKNSSGKLSAELPPLPAAGKVMYQVYLFEKYKHIPLTEEPVVLRYKGEVPRGVIIPHIILMILSIVFSVRAGLEAIRRRKQLWSFTLWATGTLFAGGLILGPIVQKFAFDAYWTGWPLGHDLTDNKTAVSFIFWLIALIIIRRRPEKKGWVLVASIIQLIVYLIPHSVLGSEIDFREPHMH